MNILVPSAGKRFLHIQYLKESVGAERVITTELSPLAPGLHAADRGYQVPPITHPDYLDTVWKICRRENIGMIVPLMDNDIEVFSNARERFEAAGMRILLSPRETVNLALDKYATARFFLENDLPAPATILASEWRKLGAEMALPVLIKPRYPARRAQKGYDIQVIHSQAELKEVLQAIEGREENYVFQELLSGTELTIDFFCDAEGQLVSVVPGERLSALSTAFSKNGGAINMGKVFHDAHLEALVRKATQALRFFGPSNFQGYRAADGTVKFTEINPRFTGATVMTRGAGRDFFQWSVDLILGKPVLPPQEDFRDVYMTMWMAPIFFETPPVIDVPEEQ